MQRPAFPVTITATPDAYSVSCCGSILRGVGDKCSCGASEIRDGKTRFPTMYVTAKTADRRSYSITAIYSYPKDG